MAINADEIKWANVNQNDPITGAPSKVAPTAEFQNDGLKANEPYPMEYINYMWDKNHEHHADLQEQINALAISAGSAILEQIFHVGAYYFSDSSQSPATRFGFGTWERVKGKFVVGVDEADSDFNASGKTGGAKNHSHTNNISINSAGGHVHVVNNTGWGTEQAAKGHLPEPTTPSRLIVGSGKTEISEELESLAESTINKETSTSGEHTHTTTGGINSSGNVPPYVSAYIWRRTA